MSKHTPGLWSANGLGCVVNKSGVIVADVSRPSWITNSAHKKREAADARLIAAAPDLLEAAQAVLSNKRGEDDWLILAVHCVALEKAIAKATGEGA
jgi:hypothetical protein